MSVRLKPVPEPPASIDDLESVRKTLPLVPKDEDDCCRRVMDRYGVPGRDDARTWITFLRALGLVAEAERGFHRTRDAPDPDELATRFRDGVYGAREVLEALDGADGALDPASVFEEVDEIVPQWERHKDPAWRRTWTERVEHLLGWAVLFGLATHTPDGYRPA